jgi:Raf kinase inhibitor-like YbhB/YbcL family protein
MSVSMLVLTLVVKSASFQNGEAIPKQYTCDGANEVPRIEVSDMPLTTVSWALVVDDPDAPSGTFTHWVIWNMPARFRFIGGAGTQNLPQLPGGVRQGKNDFGKFGWSGPCPPPGKLHHYRFRVFALDGPLALPASASSSDLERAVKGFHTLAEGSLVGTYSR